MLATVFIVRPEPILSRGNVLKGLLEISRRIHDHAYAAHIALGHRIIGVEPHLGGQVEGNVETRLSMADQKLESFARLPRCAEAGVLAASCTAFFCAWACEYPL